MRFVLTCLLLAPLASRAADLLPPNKAVEEVIDHYVDARLKEVKVNPAALADDATFLRRVTLDLAGRIPTMGEMQAYLASVEPDKKVKLVERLLVSPSYVRHQANEFDAMMASGKPGELRSYFLEAIAQNRSWNLIFRDLLLPVEDDPKLKGTSSFLKSRLSDLDRLTNDVSILFFGVNVSCAQCHDHPKVEDWKQDHFYGMKSFFSRTYDAGGFVGEREFGLIKFKPNKGAEKKAAMMFLTGKNVEHGSFREPTNDEKKAEQARIEEFKKNRQPPPPPAFSARAKLVETALLPGERDFFAKSLANRLWHRYFGLGIVSPVDQMHSANDPSHPELLSWLARDTIEHNYDIKRLTRGIVLSKTYARSSRWDGDNVPKPSLFALARVRPLTPTQLAMALRMGTSEPNGLTGDVEKKLESIDATARGMASSFEQPRDDFQVSVIEALLFSNSDRITKELLSDSKDRLIDHLKSLKTVEEKVDVAVKSVLCRTARADEVEALKAFLLKREDRPAEALKQMVWALITTSEFRFNH